MSGMSESRDDHVVHLAVARELPHRPPDERRFPYPDATDDDRRNGHVHLLLNWEANPPVTGYWDASPDRRPEMLERYPGGYDWKDAVLWGQKRARRVMFHVYGAGFLWFGADPVPDDEPRIREPSPEVFGVVEEALIAIDNIRNGPWELRAERP